MKKIIFNWKENPETLKEAKKIILSVASSAKKYHLSVITAVPFIYLSPLFEFIKEKGFDKLIKLSSQNVSHQDGGSYTGEVSSKMLKDLGVKYSIIGHSERRYIFLETNKQISLKIQQSNLNKIVPVLCIGEPEKTSLENAFNFVKEQINKNLSGYKSNDSLIVAYEPVWAIGGNKTVDVDLAVEMINKIKDFLYQKYNKRIEVLYGGSLNSKNIDEFIKYQEIDGFLVGSASLIKKEIDYIIKRGK